MRPVPLKSTLPVIRTLWSGTLLPSPFHYTEKSKEKEKMVRSVASKVMWVGEGHGDYGGNGRNTGRCLGGSFHGIC
jgi:hypothetical protein